jgi:hypothetical protein
MKTEIFKSTSLLLVHDKILSFFLAPKSKKMCFCLLLLCKIMPHSYDSHIYQVTVARTHMKNNYEAWSDEEL